MICPRCSREMRRYIIKWDECEELREYSEANIFCPCCGLSITIFEIDVQEFHFVPKFEHVHESQECDKVEIFGLQ
jgi:hypothetical protein